MVEGDIILLLLLVVRGAVPLIDWRFGWEGRLLLAVGTVAVVGCGTIGYLWCHVGDLGSINLLSPFFV